MRLRHVRDVPRSASGDSWTLSFCCPPARTRSGHHLCSRRAVAPREECGASRTRPAGEIERTALGFPWVTDASSPSCAIVERLVRVVKMQVPSQGQASKRARLGMKLVAVQRAAPRVSPSAPSGLANAGTGRNRVQRRSGRLGRTIRVCPRSPRRSHRAQNGSYGESGAALNRMPLAAPPAGADRRGFDTGGDGRECR